MKTLMLAIVIASTVTVPAFAALTPGQVAPDFTLQASRAGKTITFSLRAALRKGPAVVYFYPSAFTNGCNVQAHTFAVNMDKFTAAGATVIGVSLDSIDRLSAFSAAPEYCGGKVPVASDRDGAIARAYELKVDPGAGGFKDTRGAGVQHGLAERTTFIVTPTGRIAATIGGLAPTENVERALAEVQRLASATPPAGK